MENEGSVGCEALTVVIGPLPARTMISVTETGWGKCTRRALRGRITLAIKETHMSRFSQGNMTSTRWVGTQTVEVDVSVRRI